LRRTDGWLEFAQWSELERHRGREEQKVCGNLCENSWHVSAIKVPRPPGGTQEREFHSWVWEESIEDIPNLPAGIKQYEGELGVCRPNPASLSGASGPP